MDANRPQSESEVAAPPTARAVTFDELYVRAGELPQVQQEEGSWFVSFLRVVLVVAGVLAFFDHLGYHW